MNLYVLLTYDSLRGKVRGLEEPVEGFKHEVAYLQGMIETRWGII